MKLMMLAVLVGVLSSCNTTIGMYRDVKGAYQWTAGKFKGSGGGGGEGEIEMEYGAPIY